LTLSFASSFVAKADAPPPETAKVSQGKEIPRSVWHLDEMGNATHLQSQLHCPAAFGDYRRHDLHTYDAFGLDVSCDYLSVGVGDITLYLTKRTGGDMNADFEGGKAAVLKRMPDATTVLDKDQTFASDRNWLHAIYSRKQGAVLDGIWYAWYADWEFEIRATYAAVQSGAVMSTLAQMTAAAHETAAHLERCAKSIVPARDGALVTDNVTALVIAFAGGAMVNALPEGTTKGGLPDSSRLPVEWCAEGGVKDAADPVLLWHGLNADGQTAQADRASMMTIDDPIVLESFADSTLNEVGADLKRSDLPLFAVTHQTENDDVNMLGFFSHRPSGDTLARLISGIAHGSAHLVGSYNLKTKKIAIVTPGKVSQ